VTAADPKVTEEDLHLAKEMLQTKILEDAQKDLQRYLKQRNSHDLTNFELLPEHKYLVKNIIEINVPRDLLGESVSSFEVYGKIKVKSWAYDPDELISVLRNVIADEVDAGMFLEDVDPESIFIEVSREEPSVNGLIMHVTARGFQTYLIEAKGDKGIRLINEIKEEIAGKSVNEAENILVNFPEISDVKITVWPFFSSKIPSLKENIEVKPVKSWDTD